MTLSAKLYAAIGFILSGSPGEGTNEHEVDASLTPMEFTTGSGANQANHAFADVRSLAASANETLDLYGGLTDGLGQTINFANIKAILIKADAANGGNIVVGAAASNPFLAGFAGTTPTFAIPPDGVFQIADPAGWAVTNSSNDQLKIANSDSGAAASYTIVIIGG